MTLVVLAYRHKEGAATESLFLPLTRRGETLLDFTFKGALLLGFSKVILLVSEETRGVIEAEILPRIQKMPETLLLSVNKRRTAKEITESEALLIAAPHIATEAFLLLDATYYYGYPILRDMQYGMDIAYQALGKSVFAAAGFSLGNCLRKKGTIASALAFYDDSGDITALEEYAALYPTDDCRSAVGERGSKRKLFSFDTAAVMGLYALTPAIFPYLQGKDFAIPLSDALHTMIQDHACRIKMIPAAWAPVTLIKEGDLPLVKRRIRIYRQNEK